MAHFFYFRHCFNEKKRAYIEWNKPWEKREKTLCSLPLLIVPRPPLIKGIMPRAVLDLFALLRRRKNAAATSAAPPSDPAAAAADPRRNSSIGAGGADGLVLKEFTVTASYLEIYNER